MKLQNQIEQLISRQASEWIEVLRTGDTRQRAQFVLWLKESRRHVSEFLALVAVDRELAGIDAEKHHDLDALLKSLSRQPTSIEKLRALSSRKAPSFLTRPL